MSKSQSQVNLELDRVESESEEDESTVDEGQESLFDTLGSDSPDEPGDSASGDSAVSTDSQSSKVKDDGGLESFGVEKDPSPNNSRLDNPDGELEQDRRTNTRTSPDETEQEALFPDIENENQVTLTGEKAYNQCLFGQD